MAKISKRIKVALVILVAVVAASGVALGAYLYVHDLREDELRNSLILNCEQNGNPLREVLQRRIKKEIKQTEDLTLYEKLFPQFTKGELEALVEDTVQEREKEEAEIKPLDCDKVYSK